MSNSPLKSNPPIFFVVLSGGSGTRLWPLSTNDKPKQFHKLFNNQTLFAATLQRIPSYINNHPIIPLIIANKKHATLIAQEVKHYKKNFYRHKYDIITIHEPVGRNTMAAFSLAAHYIKSNFDEAFLILSPADHYIKEESLFHKCLASAIIASQEKKLVTLGITPNHAHTGYGYIKTTKNPKISQTKNILTKDSLEIEKFVEKPPQELAKQYLKNGNYFWNSGYYIVLLSHFNKLAQLYCGDIYQKSLISLQNATNKNNIIEPLEADFLQVPDVSIDVALAEKTNDMLMVKTDFTWSDVGSWHDLINLLTSQRVKPKTFTISHENDNQIINFTNTPFKSIGISNNLVIITNNGILVCQKDKTQAIKNIFKTK